MEAQQIRFDSLPSQGKVYPDDIEIYIKPLTIKEQIDMDRFGITQAEYFRKVLEGVIIQGTFPKNQLLFHDVQFLDLVRRLYTFDIEDKIIVKDYPCSEPFCGHKFDYSFTVDQIEFTDFSEDIFGKEFTFSDGLTVVVSPLTIEEFIEMSKKYMSNKVNDTSNIVLGYYAYCIKEIKDREFKDRKARDEFLVDYLGNLSMHKDVKILKQIEEETVSLMKPFETICPQCGSLVEVRISPSMNFHQ